jgi:transcriptional regulator with XRE-family HTH domain
MDATVNHTQTQALLEAVREKLGGITDYEIGKALDIRRQRISEYHKGTWQADAYACMKFAEVLELDPLAVLARVEADSAKSEKARAFWANFPSGLKRTALGVAFLATGGFFGQGSGDGPSVSTDPTSHNVYYVKYCTIRNCCA